MEGKYYLLYFILVTKFSDTGAYAVGSLIGRHKMIPRISPGKTWEGFRRRDCVLDAASLVFVHFLGGQMAGMNWLHAVILGIVLSVTAVIGDLIESLFKREAGVKDSGRFFPGIGGILDLLDSLLFNAPIMYLYLRHVLTHALTNEKRRPPRQHRLHRHQHRQGGRGFAGPHPPARPGGGQQRRTAAGTDAQAPAGGHFHHRPGQGAGNCATRSAPAPRSFPAPKAC